MRMIQDDLNGNRYYNCPAQKSTRMLGHKVSSLNECSQKQPENHLLRLSGSTELLDTTVHVRSQQAGRDSADHSQSALSWS